MITARTKLFIDRGVIMPFADQVTIGDLVKPDAIAAGVILHAGSRIEGASTSIGPGSIIGAEGTAVVANCQIGHNVVLGSGFFDSSVFLDGSSMGGGAHVRPGCLIEEQAGGAHTVGLKQTILMSYVTLGSLVNFCDCLISGGTSRKNHSEVGSSYIHFNFTPHQDKATPSMIGDAVHGVLLDQPPIFLGGQGGLVGPSRIAFGTVIPAGQTVRHDVLEPGKMFVGTAPRPGSRDYNQECYGLVDRIIRNNLMYIGNIKALRVWYKRIRQEFSGSDPFSRACLLGAGNVLESIQKERIKRMGELADKISISSQRLAAKNDPHDAESLRQQRLFLSKWPEIKDTLDHYDAAASSHPGLAAIQQVLARRNPDMPYLDWIRILDESAKAGVSAWLNSIVSATESRWQS